MSTTQSSSAVELDTSSRWVLIGLPVLLAMLTMIGPFSVDSPLPAFADIQDDLGVTSAQAQLLITAYMGPFALVSLFHGPLSDAVGRRPVIMGGLAVYALGAVGAALATNFEMLLAFRALQGIAAGGATIVSRTIIRDAFTGPRAQQLMSVMATVFGIAPAVAPLISGVLLSIGTWHLVFWFMAAFAFAMLLLAAWMLPETHPVERRTAFSPGGIIRGVGTVAASGQFQRVAWAGSLLFGAAFIYIGGASILLVDLLGHGEQDFWMLFVPLVVTMTVGSLLSARAAGRVDSTRVISLGYAVSVGGAAIGTAATAAGWGDSLLVPVLICCAISFGFGISGPSLQLIAMDLFPDTRGAATSGLTFAQLIFASVSVAALAPLLATSTLAFAASALVTLLVGGACWVWFLRGASGEDESAPSHSTSASSTAATH